MLTPKSVPNQPKPGSLRKDTHIRSAVTRLDLETAVVRLAARPALAPGGRAAPRDRGAEFGAQRRVLQLRAPRLVVGKRRGWVGRTERQVVPCGKGKEGERLTVLDVVLVNALGCVRRLIQKRVVWCFGGWRPALRS